jgi:hypothetical protein
MSKTTLADILLEILDVMEGIAKPTTNRRLINTELDRLRESVRETFASMSLDEEENPDEQNLSWLA